MFCKWYVCDCLHCDPLQVLSLGNACRLICQCKLENNTKNLKIGLRASNTNDRNILRCWAVRGRWKPADSRRTQEGANGCQAPFGGLAGITVAKPHLYKNLLFQYSNFTIARCVKEEKRKNCAWTCVYCAKFFHAYAFPWSEWKSFRLKPCPGVESTFPIRSLLNKET